MTTTPSDERGAADADAPVAGGEASASAASAQVALGAGRERRLHPLSWLFVLLDQLRQFALPLIALLFFGRGGGDTWEWFGLVGVAVLTLLAVVRYYTYRFRVAGGELTIRSGLLHRNVRHIPLQRIQNVALKRNLLHRLLGVAEVKLESAVGGVSAEAQMKVLSLRDAHALEVLARARAASEDVETEPGDEPDRGELLLALPVPELVRLGLTSNRGLLLGAAGLGVFSQLDGAGFGRWVKAVGNQVFGYAQGLHLDWSAWAIAVAVLILALVLGFRALSVLLVIARYFDFRLQQLDRRVEAGHPKQRADRTESVLSVESGLFTRQRSQAPLRKIQHWTIRESLLHRLFARRSLAIETAAVQASGHGPTLTDLVPIATPNQLDQLLGRWLPQLRWDEIPWQPLHPRAWRRMLFWPALLTLAACLPLCWRLGPYGLAVLLLLPWWVLRARRMATRSTWAITEYALLRRSGWLDKYQSFAEIGKLQGLQLVQSPFDRRHGMASLVVDSAGAHPLGHRLDLHYLPEAVARDLHRRLGERLARSALRW